MKKIKAWHFVGEDRMLRDGSLKVEPGYIYSIGDDEQVELCNVGVHGSELALDALQYAHGPIVCRVQIWGDVEYGYDKLAGRHREVLWMADATKTLRLFACWCVRETPLADGRKVWDLLTDERSRNVVEVVERFVAGNATQEELDAARGAAWGAARGAARDAAWGAARGAAWGAARGAARDAAWGAARDAAWDAARGAARGAAWGAARDAQNEQLTAMLEALR